MDDKIMEQKAVEAMEFGIKYGANVEIVFKEVCKVTESDARQIMGRLNRVLLESKKL